MFVVTEIAAVCIYYLNNTLFNTDLLHECNKIRQL